MDTARFLHKATLYNNVGAACLELGWIKRAWVLFKGALEVKLAVERIGPPLLLPSFDDLVATNVYVNTAESMAVRFASPSSARTSTDSSGIHYKPDLASDQSPRNHHGAFDDGASQAV
jgi:hypothetical protein